MTIEQIQSVIQAVSAPVLFVTADGQLVAANGAATEMFGNAIVGRLLVAVLRQPAILDCFEQALTSRQPVTRQFQLVEAGREVARAVTAAPLGGPGNRGAVLTFEDTTALIESRRIRRDFVANVSHELRSPLTALRGFIETLQTTARDDPAAQARFLAIMAREAERMDRLVRDLLSLSRVEAEERVRPRALVDLSAVLRAVIALAGPDGGAEGGADSVAEAPTIETAGLDAGLTVIGDADQLNQVFTNLVENALKYGKPGGTLRIVARRRDKEAALRGPAIQIDLHDQGPGIPPQHLPRLTERFYRVDNHRSRELGGTGLGLAIVKHIVNRHRGRLKITSQHGQGSTFAVILPAAPQNAGSAEQS